MRCSDEMAATPPPAQTPIQPRWLGLRLEDQRLIGVISMVGLMGLTCWSTLGTWTGAPRIDYGSQAWKHDAADFPRFVVDLDKADWPELMHLPRIGETLARRIIDCRRREVEAGLNSRLPKVPGIGPATWERLRPYLEPTAARRSPSSNP